MSAKKKILISLLSLLFALLAVVATIVITFALTQQTVSTSLNMSYTAIDIDGSVSAKYKIGETEGNFVAMKDDVNLGNTLYFEAESRESAGYLALPESLSQIVLTSTDPSVTIEYTYTNTGDRHYIASMNIDTALVNQNMTVEYGILSDEDGDGTIEEGEVKYSEDPYAVVVASEKINKYFIKISVTELADNAQFTGDFNWLLTGCDPQSKEYLSLTSVEMQATGTAGEYKVSFAEGSEYVGNVVFPSEVNGSPVTTIAQNSSLTKAQKNQVTSVYIPASVQTIGNNAFRDYQNLQTVTFEQNETTGSASVQSETGLTSIASSAFYGCIGLKEIQIPDSVTSIGSWAFCGCTGLTEIFIPNSINSIASNSFMSCSGLKEIKVAEGNTKYHSAGNCLIETASKTLIRGCNTSVIPDSVTSIGYSAFRGCTGLTGIVIPNSVTSMSEYAFHDCTGLTSVTIGSGITSIGDNAFSGCTGLTEIVIPESVTSIGYAAFNRCTGLTGIVIPDSVTSIGSVAFLSCTGLTEIVIPDSVTTIGESAFSGCTGLTGIVIPESVTSIGRNVFNRCTGLTEIVIPESVTSIGYSAFSGCTGLTEIVIPESVTSIGDNAFSGCTGLTEIVIPDSVTSIGDWAFSGCTGLTEIVIPESVTTIGYWAFYGCTGLTSIEVVEGNTKYHSASNCIIETASKTLVLGIKTSVIPTDGSVTSIGDLAFSGCTGLTEIVIPNSVTSIGSQAFYGCTGLTEIVIPDSVTSIGGEAFSGCTGLTSVIIGSGVTSIGESAFSGCTGLTSVTFENTTGWSVEDEYWIVDGEIYDIDSEDLANPETATLYLTDEDYYVYYYWTRNEK